MTLELRRGSCFFSPSAPEITDSSIATARACRTGGGISEVLVVRGEPSGIRTLDPLIKSHSRRATIGHHRPQSAAISRMVRPLLGGDDERSSTHLLPHVLPQPPPESQPVAARRPRYDGGHRRWLKSGGALDDTAHFAPGLPLGSLVVAMTGTGFMKRDSNPCLSHDHVFASNRETLEDKSRSNEQRD